MNDILRDLIDTDLNKEIRVEADTLEYATEKVLSIKYENKK